MAVTGKVKFFNQTKGFGFIVADEGGSEDFVHISALQESGINPQEFVEDAKVSYELVDNRGKKAAANLALIK